MYFYRRKKQAYSRQRLLKYPSASDFRTKKGAIVETSDLKPACFPKQLHPQEIILAQFSLYMYVHKCSLKSYSFF